MNIADVQSDKLDFMMAISLDAEKAIDMVQLKFLGQMLLNIVLFKKNILTHY